MSNIKRFIGLTLTAFFIMSAVAAPLAAQDSGGRASGGGTQRQNSLDVNSLRDVTGPDGLDYRNKMLKDIAEAVSAGDVSDEVYAVLDYMSREGLANKTIRQGQLLNDYPTIRRQVAEQLGKIGTAKAAGILIQLCRNENSALDVQRETIRALGDIGVNENGTTVTVLIFKLRGFNERNPDSDVERVLLAAVEAFDKIDKKNNGFANQSKEVQEFLDNVAKNKRFPRRPNQPTLDERAKQVLEDMIKREAQRRLES
jgi:hypothetical protein